MNQTALIFEGNRPRAELLDAKTTLAFMLAGDAYVTFQSKRTETHFTFQVRRPDAGRLVERDIFFVSVLTGPDHYEYLGCIFDKKTYHHGRKSRIDPLAPSAAAFFWTWRHLMAGKMPATLAVWHEGRCGKCGRRLTTPESIATGLGPVCASRQS